MEISSGVKDFEKKDIFQTQFFSLERSPASKLLDRFKQTLYTKITG